LTTPILTLQLPDPDLRRSRILAVSRDPTALDAFRKAVLESLQTRVASAKSDTARTLALIDLQEMRARLTLLWNGARDGEEFE